MPCGPSFARPAPKESGVGFFLPLSGAPQPPPTGIPPRNALSYGHFLKVKGLEHYHKVGKSPDFCHLSNMPIVKVTRRLHFSAGHRLHNPELSDAENREIYGLCNNPAGHGHNYGLEVTLKGEVDPKTGYVFDLKRVKRLVEELVLDDVDHANLNVDVEWMKGVIPTAENIAVEIWRRLAAALPEGMLERVLVSESERNMVEYSGE